MFNCLLVYIQSVKIFYIRKIVYRNVLSRQPIDSIHLTVTLTLSFLAIRVSR